MSDLRAILVKHTEPGVLTELKALFQKWDALRQQSAEALEEVEYIQFVLESTGKERGKKSSEELNARAAEENHPFVESTLNLIKHSVVRVFLQLVWRRINPDLRIEPEVPEADLAAAERTLEIYNQLTNVDNKPATKEDVEKVAGELIQIKSLSLVVSILDSPHLGTYADDRDIRPVLVDSLKGTPFAESLNSAMDACSARRSEEEKGDVKEECTPPAAP